MGRIDKLIGELDAIVQQPISQAEKLRKAEIAARDVVKEAESDAQQHPCIDSWYGNAITSLQSARDARNPQAASDVFGAAIDYLKNARPPPQT